MPAFFTAGIFFVSEKRHHMKKIFFIVLSISLASNTFGMVQFLQELEHWEQEGTRKAENRILKIPGVDFTFIGLLLNYKVFYKLCLQSGLKNEANNTALNCIVSLRHNLEQEEKAADFIKTLNAYLVELKQNPVFKEAEKEKTLKAWEKIPPVIATMLKDKGIKKFPQRLTYITSNKGVDKVEQELKTFLESNANLPETSYTALNAGCFLQFVPLSMIKKEVEVKE